MSVEPVGPDYSITVGSVPINDVPLEPFKKNTKKRNIKLLTYDEAISLYKLINKNQKNKTRDPLISEVINTNEKAVPFDIHKTIIDKVKADDNTYATSKSVSQSMLNISVIQTQILQMVNILQYSTMNTWNIMLIVLLSNSLVLQFIIFTLLVLLAKSTTEQVTKYCMATGMNSLVTTLSGLLLIITSAITIISRSLGSSILIGTNVTN